MFIIGGKVMKKEIMLLLIVCLISLCGCDSTKKNYDSAEELFEAGKYEEAWELYLQVGEFEDAVDKVAICEKEIGMRENADYDFLEAIEKSILGRQGASGDADYATLVNTELVYLEEFKDKTFYDIELKEMSCCSVSLILVSFILIPIVPACISLTINTPDNNITVVPIIPNVLNPFFIILQSFLV